MQLSMNQFLRLGDLAMACQIMRIVDSPALQVCHADSAIMATEQSVPW